MSQAGADASNRSPDLPGDDASLELLARLKAGDGAAWEELYLRHHDALLFSIRCRLGPALRVHVNSEEILHSVVVDALSDIRRFEPRGPGALARWLSTCVLNKVRANAQRFGAIKRAGATPLTDSIAAGLAARPTEPPCYVDADRWDSLERALGDLEDEQREVVLLRTLDGLSNIEVAERLKRTPAATSKLFNRALARLGARVGILRSALP